MALTSQDVVDHFSRISLAYLRSHGFSPYIMDYFARGQRATLLMTETANCSGSRRCYAILAAGLVTVSHLVMLPVEEQPQDEELPIATMSAQTYIEPAAQRLPLHILSKHLHPQLWTGGELT